MDTVLADPSAQHHRQVSGVDMLDPGVLAQNLPGKNASGSAEHQGFAHVAVVKQKRASHRGDSRLVAAVNNSLVDSLHDGSRGQQALGDLRVRCVRFPEAEHVGVEDGTGPFSGPQDISVHSHNPRDGAAVGIQRRRRVVGFHFKAEKIVVIEFNDPGVVMEKGFEIGFRCQQGIGGAFDVGFEERVDLLFPVFFPVGDFRIENLVFAVFRPGLGGHFQFHVRGTIRKTQFFPSRADIIPEIVALQGLHFLQAQSQEPFP